MYRNEVLQLKSQLFKADRKHSKEVMKLTTDKKELTTKLATTKRMILEIGNQQSTELEARRATAFREGRMKERKNQSRIEHQDKTKISKMKALDVERQCAVASLTWKVVNLERGATNSMKKCQSQQLEATNMMNSMTSMTTENEELRNKVIDLEVKVEEGHKLLHLSQLATPVTIIEKERKGQKGRPR